MQDKNTTRIHKALYLDSSYQDQPEGSCSFALNAVAETDQGDSNFRSNEESNELWSALPEGFIPLGKAYANNNRVILFSVSEDDSISEIGIFQSDAGVYKTHVQSSVLGFSVNNQIQATYRLRRGCEDTVYWVDGKNKPRYFNFNKSDQFQNQVGDWIADAFDLQKFYNNIPSFQNVEVLNSGGSLEPGSYSISPQYVDESLNPTEWITTSPAVKIYNDLPTKEYGDIKGSVNGEEPLNFPHTGKAIKVELGNLDQSYPYYRLAILVSNNGSGSINNVYFTDVIPTSKNFFIYTGTNHVEAGTEAEVLQVTDIIETADFIEQIENRLILANTKGPQIDFCNLQKYASKIKADCITKEVILNDINDPANPKNPVHEFNNGLGYMPGEIYSFGVVWVFSDQTLSPVFHIPGKSQEDEDIIFTSGSNVYPMATNNSSQGDLYDSGNLGCAGGDYWGVDYNGTPLVSKPVRHHRFPLRSKINKPLIQTTFDGEKESKFYNLDLTVKGTLKTPVPCLPNDEECTTDLFYIFEIRVDYKIDGEDRYFTQVIDPRTYADGESLSYELDLTSLSPYHSSNNFTDIRISYTNPAGNSQDWFVGSGPFVGDLSDYFTSPVEVEVKTEELISTTKGKTVTSEILGIKFSNIERPTVQETGGKEVIGYYIVRNERIESEKTIVDSAVLLPVTYNEKYRSTGLLQPQTSNISTDLFGLIHPEHKFNDNRYPYIDNIIQEGNFKIVERKLGKINYDDVYDGSSYNAEVHDKGNDDGDTTDGQPTSRGFDGWSFNLITRDNIVDFETVSNPFEFSREKIKDIFYLDALGSQTLKRDSSMEMYNISADNKIGVLDTEGFNMPQRTQNNLPYVLLTRENQNPYSNFRSLPYYKETLNPVYFNYTGRSEVNIFNGDSYLSPMRYVSTVFWDNRIADRKGKSTSTWKKILGGLLIVAGVVGAIITGGASLALVGAGIAVAGVGALLASSGIKEDNFNKAYAEEYDKGLRKTALDDWVSTFYEYKINNPFGFIGAGVNYGQHGPSDDTIQWIGDCISELWFETSVNTNLRNGFAGDTAPTFLPAPWKVESGNNTPIKISGFGGKSYADSNAERYPISSLERHISRKLLVFDEKRDDGKAYLGVPLGEYYNINPDYHRKNKQKIYYHLPMEYDCCSDCREEFPHRVFYSEQSYQEELSDHFRIFLPNNYRDLEGESGVITGLYRISNDLFIHTEEALWQVPRNYQERVTDQIVSFIGTGEYFAVPPRKIVDDDTGNSAGLQHRWGSVKTPAGLFFPSTNQNKLFQFYGGQLKAISNLGVSSWVKNNIKIGLDSDYHKLKGEIYPFKDNPSNPFGTGFLTAYDSRKERILFTKKDFKNLDLPNDNDFEICAKQGQLIIFRNLSAIIENEAADGWYYTGVKDCRLEFRRDEIKSRIETRTKTTPNPHTISVPISYIESQYKYMEGEILSEPEVMNNSWTLSYSLREEGSISWHSYFPSFYITTPEELFSMIDNNIWKHNKLGHYQNFYGKRYPFIVEFVSVSHPLATRVWEYIKLLTEAKKYNPEFEEFVEERFITFNKALFYNSRQSSGILNLIVKDTQDDPEDYLLQQVQNLDGDSIIIDRNERDWSLNQIRDVRVDYSQPLFKRTLESRQEDYFIDKVVNEASIDFNKDWTELESFRDKYLVIRLIFDTFDDIKLIFNYSIENESQSFR